MINDLQKHILSQSCEDTEQLIDLLESTLDSSTEIIRPDAILADVRLALEKAKNLANLLDIFMGSTKGTPKEGPYR